MTMTMIIIIKYERTFALLEFLVAGDAIALE
jgi:hypothetical protein